MKKVFFLIVSTIVILLSNSNGLLAQKVDFPFDKKTVPIKDGKIIYTQVDTIQGLLKEKIYDGIISWVALNFKNSTQVIQLKDRESGKIILKGNQKSAFKFKTLGSENSYDYRLNFTMDFTIKDGRYRIIISDLFAKIDGGQGWPIETLYNRIPDEYIFENISSVKRNEMYRAKQILNNTNEFVFDTLASISSAISKELTDEF